MWEYLSLFVLYIGRGWNLLLLEGARSIFTLVASIFVKKDILHNEGWKYVKWVCIIVSWKSPCLSQASQQHQFIRKFSTWVNERLCVWLHTNFLEETTALELFRYWYTNYTSEIFYFQCVKDTKNRTLSASIELLRYDHFA